LKDARVLEKAGAFSVVLEKIPRSVAAKITKSLRIPTIGIGAGIHCDGQVLVVADMLGLYEDFNPRFVRKYAHLAQAIQDAVGGYVKDVKAAKFPSKEESY
jgi:3-methyl-2-oxobutanoate hydroxymethyltransferase